MADSTTQQPSQGQQPRGFSSLVAHISSQKIEAGLLMTRILTIVYAVFGYFLPLLNTFLGDPYACYYKTLMASAATSALRLHQRLPRVQLSREFALTVMMEDSAHYLFFSMIFLFASAPITMALLPVLLFSVLHAASYTLTLLNAAGTPNTWWGARLLISLVELQSRNILRMVSFAEIFLMPLTAVYVFTGRTWLIAPLVYFRFLGLRYASRRNPYTRSVFYELRLAVEQTANHPRMPAAIRSMVYKAIATVSGMAPAYQTQS